MTMHNFDRHFNYYIWFLALSCYQNQTIIYFLANEVAGITPPLNESVDRARTCMEGDYAKVKLLLQARQWHMLSPPQAQRLPFPQRLLSLRSLQLLHALGAGSPGILGKRQGQTLERANDSESHTNYVKQIN